MERCAVLRVHWRWCLGVGVAVFGGGWAIWTLRGPHVNLPEGVRAGIDSVPVLSVSSRSSPAQPVGFEELRARVQAEAQRSFVGGDFSGLSTEDRRSAASEVADTAGVILTPDYERYLQYCRERGEEKPFILTLPESQRSESFRTQSASFIGQPLRAGPMIMRWRFRSGTEVQVKDIEPISMTPKRSAGVTGRLPTDYLDAIECVFPTSARTVAGEIVPCRVGIWVGRTRSSPQWRALRVMIYDIPPVGKSIHYPPI